jgi:hypothetical protein
MGLGAAEAVVVDLFAQDAIRRIIEKIEPLLDFVLTGIVEPVVEGFNKAADTVKKYVADRWLSPLMNWFSWCANRIYHGNSSSSMMKKEG